MLNPLAPYGVDLNRSFNSFLVGIYMFRISLRAGNLPMWSLDVPKLDQCEV